MKQACTEAVFETKISLLPNTIAFEHMYSVCSNMFSLWPLKVNVTLKKKERNGQQQ